MEAPRTWTVAANGPTSRMKDREWAVAAVGAFAGFVGNVFAELLAFGEAGRIAAILLLGAFAIWWAQETLLAPVTPDLVLEPEDFARLDALLERQGNHELRAALAFGVLTETQHRRVLDLLGPSRPYLTVRDALVPASLRKR